MLLKLIWLKYAFSQKINDCKIRIYNKKTYYEIYITHFSQMCGEIRREINKILENYELSHCITGHGNILLKINSTYDKKRIYDIILEITELFCDKNTELLESIEIDNIGNLILKPKNKTFENINKIETHIKWDNDKKYIYSYIPVKINYNITLENIVEVIFEEYRIILKTNSETINKINFIEIMREYKNRTNGT
jgi:hypothetical protein